MAVTLASDLFIPQMANELLGYEIFDNFDVLGKFAAADGSQPVKLMNVSNLRPGQIMNQPVISQVASLVTRQDITSTAAATAVKIVTRDEKGVRCTAKIGPLNYTDIAASISGISPAKFTAEFARQAGAGVKLYIRNFILSALRGAVTSMSGSAHTVTSWVASGTKANLTTSLLAQGRQKMGDKLSVFQSPGCGLIFRSESAYDLLAYQLGQPVAGIADFASGTGNVLTLGMPWVCADDAALLTADAGFDKYYTLGVGPGAIEVEVTNVYFYPEFTDLTVENPTQILRGVVEFTLRVPGKQYDQTNGGVNPTLANVALSTNWDDVYDDARQVGIFLLEHDSSLGS